MRADKVLTETDKIKIWIRQNLPELNPAQVTMLARFIVDYGSDMYFKGCKTVPKV